jgi:putative DNA primase/helicase
VKDGRSCHWSSNDPLNDGKVSGCGCHDAFDVFAHLQHGGDVSRAVKAAAGQLGMANNPPARVIDEPWPDPLPLPAGLPRVEPFTPDLLPQSLRPWVADVSDRMQCPADFVAVATLASAGSLIGRKVAIRPKRRDDWQIVANLWALLIGTPSLMKSPAMREALKRIHHLQGEAERAYAQALAEHSAKLLLSDADAKAQKQALEKAVKSGDRATAETLAASMAQAQAEKPPAERVYVVNDATIEALGVVLNQNPDGVLLVRDELAGWLRTMDKEGHENDRAFYLQAWDGLGSYTYRRIGRGTLKIDSTTVSIVGTIQPGVLAEYIRQAVAGGSGDDGLSQRFQLAVWPDAPTDWQNIDRYPDVEARNAANGALQHLIDLTPGAVDAERDNFDPDAIPFLRFDPLAQERFDDWHADLMRRCRSGEDHAAIESHLLKYKKLVPALALIFHLLEGGNGPVTLEAMDLAASWAKFLESHARRIYAVVGRAPALSAQLLAKRLLKGELSDLFTARDVYNRCWGGLDRERTQAALDVLVSCRWLEERPDQTGGRPTTRYAISPRLRITQGVEPAKPAKGPSAGFAGSLPQAE